MPEANPRRTTSVLRHNDIVECNAYHPADYGPETKWIGRVKAFEGAWVRVEALDVSDDPFVDNEQAFTFRSLRLVERSSSTQRNGGS